MVEGVRDFSGASFMRTWISFTETFTTMINLSLVVLFVLWASLVAQMVKNPPAVQETQVWSLGREDPLEKGMAIHSGILIWKIPWTEEHGRLQSMGSKSIRHNWVTKQQAPEILNYSQTSRSCWCCIWWTILFGGKGYILNLKIFGCILH